jgi:L-alanine-DL-glutamate epimerase-like enolase superfamily enzyme
MKITDVQAIYLRLPQVKQQCDSGQDTLIVRVETDAGITGIGEVDSAPADRGLPVVDHGFTTYINVAAALHFLNSVPNSFILEFVAEETTTLRDQITRRRLVARDGYLEVPCEPGLGMIELDDEAVSPFRVA